MTYEIREFFGTRGKGHVLQTATDIDSAISFLEELGRVAYAARDPENDAADVLLVNGAQYTVEPA